MRVLIVNPAYGKGFVRSQRWPARTRGRVQRHPDYLAIAAAVLEREGHRVKLIDAAARNMPLFEVEAIAREFRSELSVVHTTTPSIYNDLTHGEMLKKLGSAIVLVGAHASALPEATMELSPAMDYIARGEYDYTLRDLAAGLPPAQIPGLTYREGVEVMSTPPRELIQDMDALPFPAWHQINIYDYFDAGKLHPFITLISGRGCPNSCTFCILPQVLYGKKYRLRSAQKVVEEIVYDREMFPDLKEVMFEDDTLTADPQRTREFCRKMLERNIRISWSANARADLNDRELLRLMKEAGCRMLVVGYEFGDQEVLNRVNKRLNLEQMREFAALTREVGIRVHGCFMVGGPGETRETVASTCRLIQELRPDTIQISALTPYPGTSFFRWCQERGYIAARDWTEWVDAGEQSTVISYPQLPREEIIKLVDRGLFQNFYFRPSTWLHHLRTVEDFDDLRRKVKGALSLGSYWLGKRLRRGKRPSPAEMLSPSTGKPLEVQLKLIAAIACYNEEEFVGEVVMGARHHAQEVIVVDDGSTDASARVAEAAGAKVIRHRENLGKGAALNTALAAARRLNADILVLLDADGQHDPADIPRLIEPAARGQADMVVGSRWLNMRRGTRRYRMLGQWALTLATNWGSGVRLSDSQSGFRAFSRRAIDRLTFSQRGLAVESEMQFLARKHRLKVTEVPIVVTGYRRGRLNPLVHGGGNLLRVASMTAYHRPGAVFFLPGATLLGLSAVLVALGWRKVSLPQPLALGIASLLTLALWLLVVGAGVLYKRRRESRVPRPTSGLGEEKNS